MSQTLMTLHITYKGESMGQNTIKTCGKRLYLCDAFYDLADKIEPECYNFFMVDVLKALTKGQLQGDIGVLSFSAVNVNEGK